jgi:hypothetical protein
MLMSVEASVTLTFCNSNCGANLIVLDLTPFRPGSKVDVFKEIYLMITFTDSMQTDGLTDCFNTAHHNSGCDNRMSRSNSASRRFLVALELHGAWVVVDGSVSKVRPAVCGYPVQKYSTLDTAHR